MKKLILCALVVLVLGLTVQAVQKSALLHTTEAVRDGIQFIRVEGARVWGGEALPDSLPDVTDEAQRRGILPQGWKEGRHPFGGRVVIGRNRPGAPVPGRASLDLTLDSVPAASCAPLRSSLVEDMTRGAVLTFHINGQEEAACPPRTAPPFTLRVLLATRSGPGSGQGERDAPPPPHGWTRETGSQVVPSPPDTHP